MLSDDLAFLVVYWLIYLLILWKHSHVWNRINVLEILKTTPKLLQYIRLECLVTRWKKKRYAFTVDICVKIYTNHCGWNEVILCQCVWCVRICTKKWYFKSNFIKYRRISLYLGINAGWNEDIVFMVLNRPCTPICCVIRNKI